MAFIRFRCVLLFAFLAAALVAAAYAKKNPVSRKIPPVSSDAFNATMYSVLEIPQNDTEAAVNAIGDEYGWGQMELFIHKENGQPVWLEYGVKVYALQQLPGFRGRPVWTKKVPIIMTHVHNATEGSNGPKNLAERTAAFVSTLNAIRKDPSGFYGNIHTMRISGVRDVGQLGMYAGN
ncbi:unnamed protein product [Closterium sp. Yama58-4]|nr:unnamed protein product [Closterium sp. Yama58-4]